jgi:hypothetical protein
VNFLTLWGVTRFRSLAMAYSLACVTAGAQFKEIAAAPFAPAVARQKIRTLIGNTDAGNRDRTIATISGWLTSYRDILDAELIARWKSEDRANVPLLMGPLADSRLAQEVVAFAWREDRSAAFAPAYAPMLGDLMARYPESAKVFLDDLRLTAASGQPALSLTEPETETACRILLDMPDIGTWRTSALQILPRYRDVTDRLLKQDLDGPDQEKMYRALRWRADLRLDPPAVSSQKAAPRTRLPAPATGRPQPGNAYTGPGSGTLSSSGGPIPENGEYVFTNIPPGNLQLDFDTKHWEARLAEGDGQTQVLVLTNKGRGPQKRCVVHWSIVP